VKVYTGSFVPQFSVIDLRDYGKVKESKKYVSFGPMTSLGAILPRIRLRRAKRRGVVAGKTKPKARRKTSNFYKNTFSMQKTER